MFNKIFVLSVLVFLSASANAGLLEFDFSGGHSSTTGTAGNTLTFNDSTDTVSLVAAGWSFEDWANNHSAPSAAYLGHYGSGLGVTNCDNATDPSNYCDRDQHVVDNGGHDLDYVSFLFDQDVTVVGVGITVYYGNDGDVGGSHYGDADISYVFGPRPMDESDWLYQWAQGPVGTTLHISLADGFPTDQFFLGAFLGNSHYPGTNDDFKITSLTVRLADVSVPEPGTLALLGLGLVGMAARRRKKV